MFLFKFLPVIFFHSTFSSFLNGPSFPNVKYFQDELDVPENFSFGAGTSAFQTEGAWNISGKSESFMDNIMHKVQKILSLNDSADFSSNSYEFYEKDVEVLKNLEMKHYRFSMSWPRLLPTGYTDKINTEAVYHYHKLLDKLIENNIEPLVFLHHFDHPSVFEKNGGWLNETIVDAFTEYADFIFREYGNKVKKFVTINEPNNVAFMYALDFFAENSTADQNLGAVYLSAHNMIKAHAEVYHLYRKKYYPSQQGTIGYDVACMNFFPKTKKDEPLVDVAFQFNCGWFAHPVFSETGDYPRVMKEMIGNASIKAGLKQSRLPEFSEAWITKIRGAADFFALNHYISYMVEPEQNATAVKPLNSTGREAGIDTSTNSSWIIASNGYPVVPEGLGMLLKRIKDEYNNTPVHIVENGYANAGSQNDTDRIKFIYAFLKETFSSIKEYGCNVMSYYYWSLIDSYEFDQGFSARFGLAHVVFNIEEKPRTLKKSAKWLKDLIRNKKLKFSEL